MSQKEFKDYCLSFLDINSSFANTYDTCFYDSKIENVYSDLVNAKKIPSFEESKKLFNIDF